MRRSAYLDRSVAFAIPLVLLLSMYGYAEPTSAPSATPSSETQAAAPATQPQSAPAEEPESPADRVVRLRNQALDQAMKGRFAEAQTGLEEAAKLAPDDAKTRQAIQLIQDYLKRVQAVQAERKREYDYEIKRIGWANLAQKYVEELNAKPFMNDLRKTVRVELAEAYRGIATAENLDSSAAKQAADYKKESLAKIDEVRKIVQRALKLVDREKGEYFDEFRSEARTLLDDLAAAKKTWSQVKPDTPKGRWAGAQAIQPIEDRLADSVTDLEVLTARKPWKVALLHGLIAKTIAPDPEAVAEAPWYRILIQDAEQRGKKAVQDAEWYDALSAYSSLEELEPDNQNYAAEGKKVRRHVRVLRLYGSQKDQEEVGLLGADEVRPALPNGEKPQKPTSQPDTEGEENQATEDDGTPLWKEMVAGVDAEMVRKAIRKLEHSYVKPVDYRKLTQGALESIRILATTPQAAETFPGLKDPVKRKAFLESIETELADIKRPDHVRRLDLTRALNDVLARSEETVNIPVEVLVVEFADGFLDELDKFSGMIWPNDLPDFTKSTMGQFTGIGVEISKEPGEPLKVVTPLLGAPAMKAGIKAGDLILEVDGKETRRLSIEKLIDMIMGPPNTTVMLMIQRAELPKPFSVSVVRQPVNIRTVKGWQRRQDGEWDYLLDPEQKIGYIRLTQFTDETHGRVCQALRQMKDAHVLSLILDLRSNPGGLLRSATDVADEFLASGDIVSTRGRQVARRYEKAKPDGEYLKGDLVVLLDQKSASAAEILSGALKDWHRATIVGQRSYGKGSVQNVIPVRQDAYLKLTTAYYYLPSSRLIHRQNGSKDWGVDPDVEIFMTPRQMRRLFQVRRKTDLLVDYDPDVLRADLKQQYDSDLQLNTAVLLLEMMRLRQDDKSPRRLAAERT